MPLLDVADQESIHLRFKIGDRVLCWHGTWLPSTIVKLFYVQPNFPPGKCVPYKVKLDDGREIYAKADVDTVVREFAESPTLSACWTSLASVLSACSGGSGTAVNAIGDVVGLRRDFLPIGTRRVGGWW